MQVTRSLIVAASVGGLIAAGSPGTAQAASHAESTRQMEQELQALRAQVDALQEQLDQQARQQRRTESEAGAAAAQAAAAKADAAAIPARVASEVKAAKSPPGVIEYKGLKITLGGFLEEAAIYRSHNETADIGSSFGGIPYANNAVGHTSELRFTERQSRLAALVQGDVSPETHLAFYGEFDFNAAAQTANSNESNSFNPRVRNLYGTVDWDDLGLHLLAGQNWSLVTMNTHGITPRNELTPPQIDAQYVPGFAWARQPQFRITGNYGKDLWVALSLENPQTTFYTGANALPSGTTLVYNSAAGSGFNSANTLSLNHVPDVVGKIAYEAPIAGRDVHLEAFGLYRSFAARLDHSNETASGGGFGFGIVAPLMPNLLDFQISGLAGKGIGRYGSAQLPDVTFDPAGHLKPIDEIDALVGLTLHATPMLDVYLFAGEEKESAASYDLTTSTGSVVGYGYGNPLYSNSGCFSETAVGACVGNTRLVEQGTLGFWQRIYVGDYGKFQWGLQYSYTQRDAFAGVGGAPTANDSMVFASIRYFPF
ncbi:MAG TPA: hypothetical protein VMU86_02475 [Steroidobacteraceae bacterium]|nr:hypothetical protein [Steroidobacteraceae bacterium]